MPDHTQMLAPLSAIAVAALLAVGAERPIGTAGVETPPSVRARHIRVAPDVTLHVVERGDATGTPVVLLHGLSDSWSSFNRLIDELPDRWRVIAIDLRGHGESSQPRSGYAMPSMARDVGVVLDSLKVRGAYVVGHSMGSYVAQHVAAQNPDRLDGLVLIGSTRGGAFIPALPELQGAVAAFANDDAPVSDEFARGFQLSSVHGPLPPAVLDSAVAASLRLPLRVWKGALHGLATDSGPPNVAAVRTLVVWGEKEMTMPREEQAPLVQRYGATYVQLKDMGHSPHWESPVVVARILREFIAPKENASSGRH